jgi:hypothetical protein
VLPVQRALPVQRVLPVQRALPVQRVLPVRLAALPASRPRAGPRSTVPPSQTHSFSFSWESPSVVFVEGMIGGY